MKLTYIAGPMTGHKNYNFEAFDNMENLLKSTGCKVVNPANIGRRLINMYGEDNLENADYLREDIKHLLGCSQIVMLKGWKNSPGARLEHAIAQALDIAIFYQE